MPEHCRARSVLAWGGGGSPHCLPWPDYCLKFAAICVGETLMTALVAEFWTLVT
jgi:hypothetical protein